MPCTRIYIYAYANADANLKLLTRTDIEQETNGLYTQARLEKLDAAKVKAVLEEAAQMFYKRANA